MILAVLTLQQATLWEVALGIGGVVIAVVIALLGMLLYLIRSIDRGANRLHDAAGRVVEHTHKLRAAGAVDARLHELGNEAQRHAELLARKGAR